MSTLVDFLLARIAEDERAAQELPALATEVYEGRPARPAQGVCEGADAVFRTGRIDAGRLLSECAVKRRIIEVERHRPCDEHRAVPAPSDTPILRLLGLPYAGHPDYREH